MSISHRLGFLLDCLNNRISWHPGLKVKSTSLEGKIKGLQGWSTREVGHKHCLGKRRLGMKGDQFLKTCLKVFEIMPCVGTLYQHVRLHHQTVVPKGKDFASKVKGTDSLSSSLCSAPCQGLYICFKNNPAGWKDSA